MELNEQQVEAMTSVLKRTNCKRVKASGFVAAVCWYPVDGLPRKEWCDTCIATKALEPPA